MIPIDCSTELSVIICLNSSSDMATLTQVPWSKGRFDSYTLHSDGSLVGTLGLLEGMGEECRERSDD